MSKHKRIGRAKPKPSYKERLRYDKQYRSDMSTCIQQRSYITGRLLGSLRNLTSEQAQTINSTIDRLEALQSIIDDLDLPMSDSQEIITRLAAAIDRDLSKFTRLVYDVPLHERLNEIEYSIR